MWSSSRRDHCKRLALLTAVSILCISLVFISLAYRGTEQQVSGEILNGNYLSPERLIKKKCIPVCDSKDCIYQANILLKSINPEVDPCENFQTFLCGNFQQRFGPNEVGKSGLKTALIMMLKKMKDAIENIDAPPGSASAKLKIVYDSCVNIGSSDLRGSEDFKQFLKNSRLSNWPYLSEDFTFSEDDLPVLLGTLTSHLEASFLTIKINNEIQNETHVEVYFNSHFIEYPTAIERDVAVDVLKYFDLETEAIELILKDYNDVKSTLLNLNDTWCVEDCEITVIDCLSPGDEEWEILCKTIDFFLNLTHLKGIITKPGIFVKESNLFTVKELISTLKSLPNRSVANFFALKFLWNHLDEINVFFRLKKQKYYEYFRTELSQKLELGNTDRWMYCLDWIVQNMKLPLEKIYIEQYLEQSVIDEIQDMHKNYTSEIAHMFSKQNWIPVAIRFAVGNGIKNLKNSFSQLEELLPNNTVLNTYMELFHPKSESFFLNVMEDRKNRLSAYYLYRYDPTTIVDLSMGIIQCFDVYGNDVCAIKTATYSLEDVQKTPSFKVNAAFNDEGEIAYHYGIILPPFHYPGHIRLINRILFAPVVVHEVGHGVVHLLMEMSESIDSIKEAFLEKKHCIENQFSKFEFIYLGGNLNGTQYIEENLSDNLAQTFLDKLLQNFESSQDAISLPGLQYPPTQQLYMSTVEGFCFKTNLKMDIHFKTVDVHAPFEYRIIGTMQNSRGYAEAFQCPVGSYMNPAAKCSLLD